MDHEPAPRPDDAHHAPRKHGLAFLLNAQSVPASVPPLAKISLAEALIAAAASVRRAEEGRAQATEQGVGRDGAPAAASKRKRGRTCRSDGCNNYIVHKGLCCRHGGGKKCSAAGCGATAKHRGRCWKHGGSVECSVVDCTKKAKARGLCWGHGGGVKCVTGDCSKIAISNGFCWAHGGGKRCIHDGCRKPAYERTNGFCLKHYGELQHADYYEV